MLGPACCSGAENQQGSPAGKEATIGGVLCYYAEPVSPPTSAVLFCPDAFGLGLVNNKLLVDRFARETGYLVVMPDFFQGKPLLPEVLPVMEGLANLSLFAKVPAVLWLLTQLVPFLWRHGAPRKKLGTARQVMDAATQQYDLQSWTAVGYCYGGKLVLSLASEADTLVAGAVAHPSLVAVPADIAALRRPVLFCCAETDDQFGPEQAKQAEELLDTKAPGTHKFVRFAGTKHGFAVRGGPEAAEAGERAFQDMVHWLTQHLLATPK